MTEKKFVVSHARLIRMEVILETILEAIQLLGKRVGALEVQKRGPLKTPLYTESFERFWATYPIKKDKKGCARIWNSRKLHLVITETSGITCDLEADVGCRKACDRQWIEGYAPLPKTYLNGNRWNDAIEPVRPKLLVVPRFNDDRLVKWAEEHNFEINIKTSKYQSYNHLRQHLIIMAEKRYDEECRKLG